ncbi:unnamed protein product [Rhizoctonia solani]|uniref:D-lactate dehydratase n=1 Tax=Rhizoctonia solani TaxID=456999 RepID=A0A8H3DA76_9AGAM|nr:unnamed protein product [Rhizoctonia solani]
MSPRILFVFTSADKSPSGTPTGWWLAEAAHPYYFLQGKAEIDFASPKGPNPPLDAGSVKMSTDDQSVNFLQDADVKEKLANAKKLSEVDPKDYDGVLYIGGHGPMFDLATDPVNTQLANAFFRSGKITAAVCHGPGALVTVTDASGKSLFEGRNELGGKYSKAEKPFGSKVVVDGNVITGQNPASAEDIGEAIWKALN